MGIDFKRPRHIRGFRFGEVLIWDPSRPLIEKTASGSIAHITDGADDVPIKAWKVSLPASLSGYSSVDVVQCGKNILNGEDAVKTANNIRFYYTNGKYYPAGTYILSISESVSGLYVRNVSTNTNLFVKYNANFITFTLTEQTLIGFDIYKVGINQNDNVMLEVGSTASTFEPYSGTTHTAQLGRTIYGGTADVVNGTGSEPIIKYTVSSFSGTWGAVGNGYGYYITVADTTHNTAVVEPTMMVANQLFTYGSVGRSSAPTYQYGGNDGGTTVHTFILPSEYDTLTKANNFLSGLQTPLEVTLTLVTPSTFTFDGITPTPETALGTNNFWADEGDSEVTYYTYAD